MGYFKNKERKGKKMEIKEKLKICKELKEKLLKESDALLDKLVKLNLFINDEDVVEKSFNSLKMLSIQQDAMNAYYTVLLARIEELDNKIQIYEDCLVFIK